MKMHLHTLVAKTYFLIFVIFTQAPFNSIFWLFGSQAEIFLNILKNFRSVYSSDRIQQTSQRQFLFCEKSSNCTSETIKARPFQRIQKNVFAHKERPSFYMYFLMCNSGHRLNRMNSDHCVFILFQVSLPFWRFHRQRSPRSGSSKITSIEVLVICWLAPSNRFPVIDEQIILRHKFLVGKERKKD
jgi:hypothetical protein